MEIEIEKLGREFRDRFSARPRFFQAPGRVNLIGEHTDYNDGFVMPFAIDRRTMVAAAVRDDTVVNAFARDLNDHIAFDLRDRASARSGTWVDYVEGIARCITKRFAGQIRGADLIITSTVPIGAGLSSSAAIEMAVGSALLSLSEIPIDKKELALAGQQAEHEFVGTRSGIMDQFASVFGRSGNAMLLDCRSLEIDYIPIAAKDMTIAVIDTRVKHDLASSEYNTRREECEAGVAILRTVLPHITALRDVNTDELSKHEDLLPVNIRLRCQHVVSENARTILAADAFRTGDFKGAGRLMSESHRSLRTDYKVSCPELDFLIDVAREIEGVYGARMTGGGFGGCTVNLVEKNSAKDLRELTTRKYSERFGIGPDFYVFEIADGASEIIP